MHLIATTEARASLDGEAVDLRQSPGEIIVMSAADTDLACLAAARPGLGDGFPTVRLASLLKLQHPLSVDLHVERVVAQARIVIVRLLGGVGYWRYGCEEVAGICAERSIPVAFLPGDERPDPELARLSTVAPTLLDRMHRCLIEGGPTNAAHLLRCAASVIGYAAPAGEPVALPRVGLWRTGVGEIGVAALDGVDRPLALVVFYRALLQAGDTAPIEALLEALAARGLDAVGLFAPSLKDGAVITLVRELAALRRIAIVLSATGFVTGEADPLRLPGCPVLQLVLGSEDEASWAARRRGLGPRDLAMSVALPEIDGRVLTRAVSFKAPAAWDQACEIAVARHAPVADRIAWTADLAAAWVRLADTPRAARRVAIVLPNYPIRDGRLANGVGLDTPASCAAVLHALAEAGYTVEDVPADGKTLIRSLRTGVTNTLTDRATRLVRARLPIAAYRRLLAALPATLRAAMEERWGPPEADPWVLDGTFPLAVLPMGNIVVGLQPARGHGLDPSATYHDPDLPPPHAYLAFHLWLRHVFSAQALVHLGKHGNLEWLPGKALALSAACWPEAVLGPLPQLYPFIVNDPGEGTQAKRRTAAVIIDHLTPPLARAGSYGELARLERLLDELAEAQALDPRRALPLRRDALDLAGRLGIADDLALDRGDATLVALDRHLCEIKELQIRDGLHILGAAPEGAQRVGLTAALLRPHRGDGPAEASLLRALASDLGLGLDPLAAESTEPWTGPRPAALANLSRELWRTTGDTVERLELVAMALLEGKAEPAPHWSATLAVLAFARETLGPLLDTSAAREIGSLLDGLDGRAVAPGPSGAPTRGRLDVLPTGRNFFSVDTRAVPTPAAWRLGWESAGLVLDTFLQRHGDWPTRLAVSAWGTANMRTGGEDIAQALALMGCRPLWDAITGRVTGVEVLPLSVLGRPRVDVTVRISGFFRDAFPAQLEFLDDAVRAVAALDEPKGDNPLAGFSRAESRRLETDGVAAPLARRLATARLFGAAPGAYGTGLQGLIDDGAWSEDAELGSSFTAWGGFAYGRGLDGLPAEAAFRCRLAGIEVVLHNQDNREHDLLDSDDYWQFEGGLAAAARAASGTTPEILHADHSRPERLRVRPFAEEIALVVRGRATNPRWLEGVMRHGYKGAFEIAATVDYLIAFAATTRLVADHHIEALFDAYLVDERVRGFMATHNPDALRETALRFAEAIRRGLWRPRRNDAAERLAALSEMPRAAAGAA